MEFKKHFKILSISIGLIYFYFGFLKFFPSHSPAEEIAMHTLEIITFDLIPCSLLFLVLAAWETLIGIALIFNRFKKTAIVLALTHMVMTFSPFILLPEEAFQEASFLPSLLGQYIFKNLIIIAALMILWKDQKMTS
ncbi:doxx family protein [Candidatus Kapabacteria bacterium]|nr:doxx family protein [Candidatus Kapabacteria bacterium]